MDEPGGIEASLAEREQRGFHVGRDLGAAGVFEERGDGGEIRGTGVAGLPGESGFGAFESDGERRAGGDGGEPVGVERLNGALTEIFGGSEFLKQAVKFELFVDLLEGGDVGRFDFQIGKGKLDGNVGFDLRELLGHKDALAIVLQAFAVHLALDFAGAVEGGFDAAELFDEIAGALVADAGSAGDVVDSVAFQREEIGHLAGFDAHEFFDFGGVVPSVVLGGVEHGDAAVDQLQHVFIARDDDDIVAGFNSAAGEGADNVVGFEAGELEDGDAHSLDEAADPGDLLGEIARHFSAIGFVFGKSLFAVSFADALEDGGHVDGREGLRELAQHVVEDKDGFSGNAGAGAHGRSAGARAGVVGAEDETVAVDQEKPRSKHFAHHTARTFRENATVQAAECGNIATRLCEADVIESAT